VADPPKLDFSGIDPETGERWLPRKVVKILGLRAVNDEEEIRAICSRVLKEKPQQAVVYRTGKGSVLGFFVKKVMDATRNGANPEITTRVLKELLG
jgi:Asp-tRNA(Asn)/Glu-tRNA(Gln) amidotransferase B subunit